MGTPLGTLESATIDSIIVSTLVITLRRILVVTRGGITKGAFYAVSLGIMKGASHVASLGTLLGISLGVLLGTCKGAEEGVVSV